jgi:ligand-binding sensor domain-containing protein/signal transduction histidine kinase
MGMGSRKNINIQLLAGYITTLLLACLLSLSSHAQRYSFHNLSVDDGLVQSQATCLTQDKTGSLWIGTLGGLSRYDGKNFTNYTIRNGLLNNTVRAIAADSAGNMWIGTQSGLSRFNGKKFMHFTRQPTNRTQAVNQQVQVVNDTTWWRVQGDVYYITDNKITYFATPGPEGIVTSMLAEKGGLWLAKDGVVYHHENGKWVTLQFYINPEDRKPNTYRIYRDNNGLVWFATNAGLYKVVGEQLIVNPQPSSFFAPLTAVVQDKSGALWLGTGSGVIKVSENIMSQYGKPNGLSDNYFADILVDAEGNIWMASDGQGIFRFSGTQFSALDEDMGLPSGQVMAIASNKRDSLFIGTYDAGLYVFKEGKIGSIPFPLENAPGITSLLYTSRGRLWIGTRGAGLWAYEHEIFRQYSAPERHFPSNQVNTVYEDKSKRLWVGFANGAVVLDNDTFKTAINREVPVLSFLDMGDKNVLVATEAGLFVHANGEAIPYKTNTIADSSIVNCFVLQEKVLWMGTRENGVIRYNTETGKALVINKNHGLRSDFIYNIIADKEGNIWVGTGFGIHKIKMGANDVPQVTFYGKAQGITGMESNINAVLKMPNGSIWFGTTNGAMHYQPSATVVSSAPGSIIMQSVKLPGEVTIDPEWCDSMDYWYGVPYNLRLPPKYNNISFAFQAVTLSGAHQMLYRYRIDGIDVPWSDWSPTNSVSYSALPPGEYVFRVQCRGAGGQASNELAYPFEIITPFQKTKWFRFSILGACILFGIFLQYTITGRKERRKRLLTRLRSEEQAKIRLRTAEDFHDEIGNKLTRINVLTNVLKNKIPVTPDTARILGQIEDNTAQLYSGTRDILWSLKPSNDSLYEILYRIRDFGIELFQDTEIAFSFEGIDEKWRTYRLPMDMSRNLIMIFKEALNNTLKYSKASKVSIEVELRRKNVLQLIIRDDGQGFDVQQGKRGNGINNMLTRAGRMNGRLYIDSREGKGTIISLTFRLPAKR